MDTVELTFETFPATFYRIFRKTYLYMTPQTLHSKTYPDQAQVANPNQPDSSDEEALGTTTIRRPFYGKSAFAIAFLQQFTSPNKKQIRSTSCTFDTLFLTWYRNLSEFVIQTLQKLIQWLGYLIAPQAIQVLVVKALLINARCANICCVIPIVVNGF